MCHDSTSNLETFVIGKFECRCPPLWNGVQCEIEDPTFPGGLGHPVDNYHSTPTPEDEAKRLCVKNKCYDKGNNNKCDVSKYY